MLRRFNRTIAINMNSNKRSREGR